ncbi:TldD/PmbA family protein [Vacuolonema iberomarrocanum]|uniref:TldD/PmbA family protein n=1 Tax=Vacuolonema iberomarrocanum TaxID=3454632 RepID=UPI0019F5DBC6|nr:TldD/PmbA family protein [filamentous cyanobacterium LEGE 07170]
MSGLDNLEQSFIRLTDTLHQKRTSNEQFTLQLSGEQSQFVRFNRAKVRQTGCVIDGNVILTLMQNQRGASFRFSVSGDVSQDEDMMLAALEQLRQELPQLPADPYQVLPEGDSQSRDRHTGNILSPDQTVSTLLKPLEGMDFAGLYAGGSLVRGYADSAGQQHWFQTDSFAVDYSIYTADGQAVKGTMAGDRWDDATYLAQIADSKHQLKRLTQTPKAIPRGNYRVYLAPGAVAELIDMFSWGALSEAAFQQGSSALAAMRREHKTLSPKFTLTENFSRGMVPRFNDLGEVAPIELPLIERGDLVNTLISSRTAKEYDQMANGADGSEGLRAPEVAPGNLEASNILSTLDTGLYLANLHYLNWSDRPTGRITGMTRYACFWVENGAIVAPIENLRFDESLYRCFGDNLVDLTDFQEFIPNLGTYEQRSLGGKWLPGALIEDFTFTL